ncbi:anhydro-N-acetylmuramic acid kinase, partial [Flavobacteriales bacterium]|nr:anhydro-N-acetylmuramic acid kinase [Flavobacteriales bacterium]
IGKLLNDKEALFTGGGVFNSYLLSRIKFYSKSKIIIPDKRTIEFKEALIFAFLGVLRARGEVNCLQSVTGAIKDNCSGEINNP